MAGTRQPPHLGRPAPPGSQAGSRGTARIGFGRPPGLSCPAGPGNSWGRPGGSAFVPVLVIEPGRLVGPPEGFSWALAGTPVLSRRVIPEGND